MSDYNTFQETINDILSNNNKIRGEAEKKLQLMISNEPKIITYLSILLSKYKYIILRWR